MSRFILVFLLLYCITFLGLFAQEDSIGQIVDKKWHQSRYLKESYAPIGLMLGSAAIIAIPNLKVNIQEKMTWNNDQKSSYINMGDDFIRHVPTIATYLLSDAMHDYGFKAKHRFIDRTIVITTSYIVSDFIVHRTKKLTQVARPNKGIPGGKDDSFPSQHTAMAFVGATFLHRELGHISPWISVGGYLTAAYVGYCRIARNRHWTSDVLMGAAVGILATNACYWAYDGVMSLINKSGKNMVFVPYTDFQHTGISFSYQF